MCLFLYKTKTYICMVMMIIFNQSYGMQKNNCGNKNVSTFLNSASIKSNMKNVANEIYGYTKQMVFFSLPSIANAYTNSSAPEPVPYLDTSTFPFTVIAVSGVLGCCFICCGVLTKANNQERENKKLLPKNANFAGVIIETEDDTEIYLQSPNENPVDENIERYHSISLSDDSD